MAGLAHRIATEADIPALAALMDRACGYAEIDRFEDGRGGAPVPLVRMGKALQG